MRRSWSPSWVAGGPPPAAGAPPPRLSGARSASAEAGSSTALHPAKPFFHPLVDQLRLIDATLSRCMPDCLTLIPGQRNAHNVRTMKHSSRHLLEFALEVGYVVVLPERGKLLNGVSSRNPSHHRFFQSA